MSRSQRRRTPSYSRRAPRLEPYDRVLIVCEGQKTEPNYFRGLQRDHGLSSVNITVISPPHSDPLGLVNEAIDRLNKDGDIDRGFCVFDRDQHANFAEAVARIEQSELGRAGRLTAITSTPCFEVWVLLHFRYSTMAYVAAGGSSACECVIRDVREHFRDYAKAHPNAYSALAGQVAKAFDHADRLEKHNMDTDATNPATQMHRLVRYLAGLKRR